MNILKSAFMIFLVISINGCVFAYSGKNYEEAKNSYKEYKYIPNTKSADIGNEGISREVSIQKEEIKIKDEEFKKIKERWADLIRKPSVVNTFFDFETEKSKKIREIAATDKINELLTKEIDLDLLIVTAFEKNPEVAAAKKGWEASLEKYDQATRLDNLLSQYKSFIADSDTKITQQMRPSVKKNFPLPGVLTLKGDIVEKEVLMATARYVITVRDLITEISETYGELLFINEAIDISEENLRLLGDLAKIASLKYSTGITRFSEVINAQIEQSKLASELLTLKDERKTIEARVNRYLSRDPEAPLGMPKNEDLKIFSEKRKTQNTKLVLQDLFKSALQNQQELKLLNLKIEATNLMITMAEKEFYPNLAVGFSYQDNPPLINSESSSQTQMREMPPFWFGTNDAYIRESGLNYQKLGQELTEAKNKLFLDIKEAVFQIDKADRQIDLYEGSLIPQARKVVDVAQTEYSSGKIDFLDILDSQQKLLEFSLNYQMAIKEYNRNFFRLEKIVGIKLQ